MYIFSGQADLARFFAAVGLFIFLLVGRTYMKYSSRRTGGRREDGREI